MVTDQRAPLRPFAAYPSSDGAEEPDVHVVEPFGPGGDTTLTGAARPVAHHGAGLPAVRPTEDQALHARRRSGTTVLDVVPDAPQALPVLSTSLIRRYGDTPEPEKRRELLSAAETVPLAASARRRRRTDTVPVSRPETTTIGPLPAPGKSSDRMQRGAYPSTRAQGTRPGGRARLRSILQGEAAPTAPMRVVRSWTDTYAGLGETHQLVAEIAGGEMPRAEAERRLDGINAKPKPYSRWMVSAALVVAVMALTIGMGGSPTGAGVAGVSWVVVQSVAGRLRTWRIPEFFVLATQSGIATVFALLLSWTGLDLSPALVIAGGIILLLPTTRMVSTMQDAINGFPVTAAGRLLSTAMAFLGLVAGIAGGVSLAGYLGMPRVDVAQGTFVPASPVVNTVFMLVGTALLALSVHAKPQHVLSSALAGFAGLLVYHAGIAVGLGGRMDTALAAVVSASVATLLAAYHRVPQLIVAIPALTFLLPGLSIFRGMYMLTVETETYAAGIVLLANAMVTILALASGVVLGKYLMRPFVGHLNGTDSRRNRRR